MKTRRIFSRFALLGFALAAPVAVPLHAEEPAAVVVAAKLPVVGPAPDWKLTDLTGAPLGRDALKGKVVVVDFWATWCPPCVHEIPGYIALQKKYGEKGLVIVGLSADRAAGVVTPFAKKNGINYPLAMATPEVIELFGGVEGIPTTFLIDREGNIRHKKVGAMETDEYEKLVVPLL
jgi:thiol-disulfide isomerase/thioredoxin